MSVRMRMRVAGAAATLMVAAVVLVASTTAASAATTTISSAGPLTNIGISTDLNCSVNHTGDTSGEWYGDTACGTLLASGGTLYGPSYIPAGGSASPRTTWTEVSQSAVTGSGTSGDPYKIVTVATAGASGLQVTETDTYVIGEESYRNDVTVTNTGAANATGVLYRGGDCFLQDSDFGYGIYSNTSGAVTCTTDLAAGSRIEQFLPLTAGSDYFEGYYNTLWANIGTQNPLPNTCDCATNEDNSIGLSWNLSLGAGAAQTFSSIVTFSPLGQQPLTLTKTADAGSVAAGGSDGYTITANNPNAGPVTLTTLTDTLPTGFSYQSGTTSGATTTDPGIVGQQLTWSGIVVPGGGSASVHFGVTASSTAGIYTDDAEGTASGVTIVGTGDTAPVTVTSSPTSTGVTTSLSGGGNSGTAISVLPNSAVTDSATLTGTNAATATGTVTYNVYSNNSCTGTPVSAGVAQTITTPGTLPSSASVSLATPGTYYWQAVYGGDASNLGSSSTCGGEVLTVLQPRAAGAFLVGDKSAGNLQVGNKVNFWGAQWWKNNALSGGPAPAALKGFTNSPITAACGVNWTTRPGNSASPPGTLPSQIVVIVTSKATQTGSTISGNTVHVLLVNVGPGYGPGPGHAGNGTIAATIC
jgi:uncharacterized repeat protein (TIGR01451 family)